MTLGHPQSRVISQLWSAYCKGQFCHSVFFNVQSKIFIDSGLWVSVCLACWLMSIYLHMRIARARLSVQISSCSLGPSKRPGHGPVPLGVFS